MALKNTLEKIGVQKVNLIGWSHGGEVSLDFALNNPNRIKTMTLIEPAAYWVAKAYGQYKEDGDQLGKLFNSFHDPPTPEDLISFLKINGLVPPNTDPRSMPRWPVWNSLKIALLSLHTVIEHSDNLSRLKALRDVPVLLVRGRESVGFNAGIVDMLSEALGPGAKVLVLPDGHACHIVAMDQFIAAFEEFMCGSM